MGVNDDKELIFDYFDIKGINFENQSPFRVLFSEPSIHFIMLVKNDNEIKSFQTERMKQNNMFIIYCIICTTYWSIGL